MVKAIELWVPKDKILHNLKNKQVIIVSVILND